jgi:hypothetical protein
MLQLTRLVAKAIHVPAKEKVLYEPRNNKENNHEMKVQNNINRS